MSTSELIIRADCVEWLQKAIYPKKTSFGNFSRAYATTCRKLTNLSCTSQTFHGSRQNINEQNSSVEMQKTLHDLIPSQSTTSTSCLYISLHHNGRALAIVPTLTYQCLTIQMAKMSRNVLQFSETTQVPSKQTSLCLVNKLLCSSASNLYVDTCKVQLCKI